jgi:hypothetical protein
MNFASGHLQMHSFTPSRSSSARSFLIELAEETVEDVRPVALRRPVVVVHAHDDVVRIDEAGLVVEAPGPLPTIATRLP